MKGEKQAVDVPDPKVILKANLRQAHPLHLASPSKYPAGSHGAQAGGCRNRRWSEAPESTRMCQADLAL